MRRKTLWAWDYKPVSFQKPPSFKRGSSHSHFKDMSAVFPLARPFLLKTGVIASVEEFNQLYQTALAEALQEDFCALGYLLTAWGEKPDA